MVLIEGRIWVFMTGFEKDEADVTMTKGGGQMEVGVGQALGARVGVVQEVRMGTKDPLEEKGVARVNGSANPDRSVDPSKR